MEYLSLLPAAALGYITCKAATHPDSKIWKRLSRLQIAKSGRVQVFPSIRIRLFGRTVHFHHWLNFSLLLSFSFISSVALLDSLITRGLLLGGIIQGLTLPRGHRMIIYRNHPALPPLSK